MHMWGTTGHFSQNPMGIHWTGLVFGLALVISCGYWTTDFLVVQRVLAANNLRSARMAPIIGAAFKMAVPFIVILPGLLALAVLPYHLVGESQAVATGQHSYNEVLPLMLVRYCGPGLLGLGVTALIAGFMSGMAGNVSAFSTVWTYDIYGAFLNKKATDQHYVAMGRVVHICRRADLGGHGVPGAARGQHHGLRAGAVQLLYRAAVRHGDPGHAVEADHKGRRLLGIAGGNVHGDRAVSVGALRSLGAALRSALARREDAGGGHVSRAVVVAGVRNCNRGGELCDASRSLCRSWRDWCTAWFRCRWSMTTTGIRSRLCGRA